MPQTLAISRKPLNTAASMTIRGWISTSGQQMEHVQYLTPSLVVTRLGGSVILHSVELGGRFLVDLHAKSLRRVQPLAQSVQIAHLRELVGTVSVHRDKEPVEVDGFTCRRYRLCNDSSRMVVAAEALCARVEALGATALHQERSLESGLHPFALPLERDELVVRSMTRTFANGFHHVQEYRHGSIVCGIDEAVAIEAYVGYRVIEG